MMPTTIGWIRYAFGLGTLLIVGGCEPSVENSQNSESAEIAPVGRLDHYALGRPVSAEEIALWDIDVMPDGEGLPEGSGRKSSCIQLHDGRPIRHCDADLPVRHRTWLA
jgi:hypothetical protein